MDRRKFLATAAASVAATALSPDELFAADYQKDIFGYEPKSSGTQFEKGSVILFTGDSITDGNREKKYYRLANHIRALGHGYVQLTSTKMHYMYPDKELKVYNTGVNGDTISKLMERLQTDCIKLKPDFVSILIGVNDYNLSHMQIRKGNPEQYEKEYRDLLKTIKRHLPKVKFIIGEPYALKGVRDKVDEWYPGFESYQAIASKIAEEFNSVFIPYQSVYENVCKNAPDKWFSTDGVHPSLAGVRLMSDAWLSYVNPK